MATTLIEREANGLPIRASLLKIKQTINISMLR